MIGNQEEDLLDLSELDQPLYVGLTEVVLPMELVVRKNDLLKELSLLQGIVERKNTIPILANVLIDASKDHLSLLATDLDVGLRSQCEAVVTKPGRVSAIVGTSGTDGLRDVPPTAIARSLPALMCGSELPSSANMMSPCPCRKPCIAGAAPL